MDDAEELKQRFKLICRKCGSENVVVDIDPGSMGSEETGWMSGDFSIGCNDCKQNDFHMSI